MCNTNPVLTFVSCVDMPVAWGRAYLLGQMVVPQCPVRSQVWLWH
jgi:hypothetical protein